MGNVKQHQAEAYMYLQAWQCGATGNKINNPQSDVYQYPDLKFNKNTEQAEDRESTIRVTLL